MWALIIIKLTAAAGLVVGIWTPGIALAPNLGVIAYFLCAVYAHIRARFLGRAFWLNCLGMLLLATSVCVASLLM